jgi:hypothetical protein
MTLPVNDDFANCELSIEELDAIAAGGIFGRLWNGIKSAEHSVANFARSDSGGKIIGFGGMGLLIVGSIALA